MNIDTSRYDKFRQGIYSQGIYFRQGILPRIRPSLTGVIVEDSSFGQAKGFRDDTAYDDLARFRALSYIRSTEDPGRYAQLLTNVNLREPSQMDGIIEPLEIRAVITRILRSNPGSSRSIKGEWGNGNADSRQRFDWVDSVFQFDGMNFSSPFVDRVSHMGDTPLGSIQVLIDVSMDSSLIDSFVDRQKRYDEVQAVLDEDVKAVLEIMSPGSDNYMRKGQRSARTGFTYQGASLGIDSIAFGGLRRV